MFHVSLLKQWRPSLVQQVPGEVELDDADAPQYFDVKKNSSVAVEFQDPVATTKIFGPVGGVSC